MNNILLVEDEPTNMGILSSYLCDGGYTVTEATDGQAAWNILEKNKNYSVVITDRRMPIMDGLELSKKIKSDPALRSVPIIMQTAASNMTEVSEGVKTGVYYYLVKPYDQETLLTLVKAAVRDREKSSTFEQRLLKQRDALSTITQGEFHLNTPGEVENIAFMLGSLFPRPELAVSGLYELLINAIEHGNLNIGFEEKSRLLKESKLETEIKARLQLPENQNKRVIVKYFNSGKEINITITDQGEGFNWRPYMEIEPSRANRSNGRGIAKANLLSFDQLNYIAKGNEVRIISKVS